MTAMVKANTVEMQRGGLEVQNLTDLRALGDLLARSGYFRDAKDAAQAAVKVQAGLEIGVAPIQAMTQIHIVEGKPALSATLIAALIKRSGRYNYRVVKHDEQECAIAFTENGQQVGVSTFTMQDAERAGVTRNPVWGRYRRNMLFARSMSNGARWYCPDVFGGAVYVPEELGADVNGEGEPVSVKLVEPAPAAKLTRATVAELQQAARRELDRLLVGDGMNADDAKVARTAAVKRINGGKAPRTVEEWASVLEALEAEETPTKLDGATSAEDSET